MPYQAPTIGVLALWRLGLAERPMRTALLGPAACRGCRAPLWLLGDRRWHDVDGVHVCEGYR